VPSESVAGAVVDEPRRLSVAEVRRDPRLFAILLEHALRGVRVQQLLRAVLVVFVTVTVIAVPPAHYRTACYVTAALYAASALGIGWVSLRGGERAIRFVWLALFVDLLALGVLSVLASQSEQSWTADVLVNGFFVVPVLAGTQLRPGVAAAVVAPAVLVYLGSLIAAQNANAEPSASIVLRTFVLAGLGVACVLLSSIQRSRVLTIAALADDRTRLLGELVDVESRARGALAEELHDGALQYLLAARQDVDDARRGDATSLDRVEVALRESAALLRAKVSQLHPAVLEQAGLLQALRELVRVTAERNELDIELVAEGLDESMRSSADYLLYSAASELLTNVTKHARAHTVKVALQRRDARIRLTVADDGTGIDEGTLEQRLAEGHVGVSSQRVRVMAAGGSFYLRRGERGTVGEVELPLERG
jgi:two-component system, NarL family, sensor kinase